MPSMDLCHISYPGVNVVATPDAVATRRSPLPIIGKGDRGKGLFLGRSGNRGWETQVSQIHFAIVNGSSALETASDAIAPIQQAGRAEGIGVIQDKVEHAIDDD